MGPISHLSAHTLTAEDIQWIGEKIYQNETGGKAEHLTFWSQAEEFPSLGLGHFIWLPSGLNLPFTATFPQMVAFVSKTHPTPDWMKQPHPPWQTKAEFDQARSSPEMNELRSWLKVTKEQQTQFIVQRFQQGALGLTESLEPQQAQAIQVKMNRLMQNRYGQYALIDYVNFKGWGTDANERYQGEGWGLLQLLQAMPDSEEILDNNQLLQAFSQAGKQVLARRIELSPIARNEQRWMPGWAQRMDSYLP